MNLAVLAIDPATTTGWAHCNGESGTVDLARPKIKNDVTAAVRHGIIGARYERWLDAELTRYQVGVVVIETQSMARGAGAIIIGLRMITLAMCARHRLIVEEVTPATWQAWARRERGWTKADKGDEADARTILAWWRAIREPLLT